jgi:hypothetical protein
MQQIISPYEVTDLHYAEDKQEDRQSHYGEFNSRSSAIVFE